MINLNDYLTIDGNLQTVDDGLMANAQLTVDRANELLDAYYKATKSIEATHITSGFRTAAKNASIPNASPHSRHMSAQAIDLYDPDGLIDDFCLSNPTLLAELYLWLEHPAATRGWCHVQTVPPKSGKRIYYP